MKKNKRYLLKLWWFTRGVAKEVIDMSFYKGCNVVYKSDKHSVDEFVVFDYNGFRYVVIGGSSKDPEEWEENLEAYPVEDGTHKGYNRAGRKIYHKIKRLLKNKRVIWLGHSRGGALVQKARLLHGKGMVYTFGSPRLFTRKKLKELSFEHLLIRSKGDGVTRLPWAWLPPFWKRYSTEEIVFPAEKGSDHKHYDKLINKYL